MGDECSPTSWKESNNLTKFKTLQIKKTSKKFKEEL